MKTVKLKIVPKYKFNVEHHIYDTYGKLIKNFDWFYIVKIKRFLFWRKLRIFQSFQEAKTYVKNYPDSEQEESVSVMFREVKIHEKKKDENSLSGRLSVFDEDII